MSNPDDSVDPRWLLKAVRESAGELMGLFSNVDEAGLRWRPAAGDWCLKEIAAHLRDAELLCQQQIDAILQSRDPLLPYEPIDVLPAERDYVNGSLHRFLNEYESARSETMWLLRMLDYEDWQRTGEHPYRGRVSVHQLVRELHEHDLQYLYEAMRLRDGVLALKRR